MANQLDEHLTLTAEIYRRKKNFNSAKVFNFSASSPQSAHVRFREYYLFHFSYEY